MMTTTTMAGESRTNRRPLIAAGTLLGIGMGGFVDGIVLHQMLQVHNMLSAKRPRDRDQHVLGRSVPCVHMGHDGPGRVAAVACGEAAGRAALGTDARGRDGVWL